MVMTSWFIRFVCNWKSSSRKIIIE